jgi:hypothetical protein
VSATIGTVIAAAPTRRFHGCAPAIELKGRHFRLEPLWEALGTPSVWGREIGLGGPGAGGGFGGRLPYLFALSTLCPSVIALKAIVSTQQATIVTKTPFQP